MTDADNPLVSTESSSAGDAEAINYLKQALAEGQHWYRALLAAIGLWASAEEVYKDRAYCYLIDGEAFDWLLLAERLCDIVDDFLPQDESYRFYFTQSTQRLEKVFFFSQGFDPQGRYIWCDLDNFQRTDGILIPLHRRFTYAVDERGERLTRPFLEQWVNEVRFGSSVDSELFTRP